jgi:methylmalonyl-CoA mutase C-terminal domain/subunit
MEAEAQNGRRVRVLIAILGLDQHETGALAVSAMLRDAGVEVIYLGRFASPESVAAAAVEESADVVGISCHSWEYIHYLDDLLRALERGGERLPLMIGGSVISPSDKARLLEKGVSAVFGAGASSDDIVATVRKLAGAFGSCPRTRISF